jgi:hypothetical protein
MRVTFLLIPISLLLQVSSLYFNLFKGQKRCFHDEFYSELAVMIRYNILDKNLTLNTKNDNRFEITLLNDNGDEVHRHASGKLNSKFSYVIEKSIFT